MSGGAGWPFARGRGVMSPGPTHRSAGAGSTTEGAWRGAAERGRTDEGAHGPCAGEQAPEACTHRRHPVVIVQRGLPTPRKRVVSHGARQRPPPTSPHAAPRKRPILHTSRVSLRVLKYEKSLWDSKAAPANFQSGAGDASTVREVTKPDDGADATILCTQILRTARHHSSPAHREDWRDSVDSGPCVGPESGAGWLNRCPVSGG